VPRPGDATRGQREIAAYLLYGRPAATVNE